MRHLILNRYLEVTNDESRATMHAMNTTLSKRIVPRSIYLIPYFTDIAGMLLIFAVSRYLAESGVGLREMGLIGSGHALASSLSSFICGSLSDRVGRTKLILPGTIILLVASVVCGIAPLGRALSLSMYWLSGIALGMIHPATIAWINTGEPQVHGSRSVSHNLMLFCVSWNLGVLTAQIGGGALYFLSTRWPFAAAAAAMAIVLVVTIVLHRRITAAFVESARDARGVSTFRSVATPTPPVPELSLSPVDALEEKERNEQLSDTFVRLSWFANLGGAVAVSLMLHLFPQLVVGLDIPPHLHGAILAFMRLITILVYFVLHFTRFWHYRASVTAGVQIVAAVGLMVIFFADGVAALLVGVTCVALLFGFNYFAGIYYGSTGHAENRRGFASGMHEASLGLGVAIGSLVGGLLGGAIGDRTPYMFAAAVLVLMVIVEFAHFTRRRNTR